MKGAPNRRNPHHDDEDRLLYSRQGAARQLSISVRALDYLIAGRTFRTVRIGKRVLIPRSELVRYANANHYEPVVPVVDPSPA